MTNVTTIKVSKSLRDRIKHDAERHGVPIAALLAELLDRYERDERLAAVGRVYRAGHDESEESLAWDVTLADGLDE
jgi:predicted DNA-binding ribbon-helix-helix protein